MRRRGAIARAVLVAAGVVALDQVAKAVVRGAIDRGQDVELILGVTLTNVRNSGVAFGLFAGGGALLTVVTVAALVALGGFFAAYAHRPGAWIPIGLLLGGAAGNLLDRLRQGWVTDFIDLPWWPAFNLADIAITFGVLSLLLVTNRHG